MLYSIFGRPECLFIYLKSFWKPWKSHVSILEKSSSGALFWKGLSILMKTEGTNPCKLYIQVCLDGSIWPKFLDFFFVCSHSNGYIFRTIQSISSFLWKLFILCDKLTDELLDNLRTKKRKTCIFRLNSFQFGFITSFYRGYRKVPSHPTSGAVQCWILKYLKSNFELNTKIRRKVTNSFRLVLFFHKRFLVFKYRNFRQYTCEIFKTVQNGQSSELKRTFKMLDFF